MKFRRGILVLFIVYFNFHILLNVNFINCSTDRVEVGFAFEESGKVQSRDKIFITDNYLRVSLRIKTDNARKQVAISQDHKRTTLIRTRLIIANGTARSVILNDLTRNPLENNLRNKETDKVSKIRNCTD